MNTKVSIAGACVAASVAVAGMVYQKEKKRNLDDIKSQYDAEMLSYAGAFKKDAPGEAEAHYVNAQRLRDSLDPVRSARRKELLMAAIKVKNAVAKEALLRQAVEADPESYSTMLTLAGCLRSQKKMDEARIIYQKVATQVASPIDALTGKNMLARL